MKSSVLKIIENHPEGISEFDLMKQLEAADVFLTVGDQQEIINKNSNQESVDENIEATTNTQGEETGENLLLFHKHFALMHALYQLQDELIENGKWLDISPLSIKLTCVSDMDQKESASNALSSSGDEKLKAYYLDWDNYLQTTEHDVKKMLTGFWEKIMNPDARAAALNVLDLPMDASHKAIKLRYRQLAAKHHPDKGGSQDAFIVIQEAFDTLS